MASFKGKGINLHLECTPTKLEYVLGFVIAIVGPIVGIVKFFDDYHIYHIFAGIFLPMIYAFLIILKHNYIDKDVEKSVTKFNDFKKKNEEGK